MNNAELIRELTELKKFAEAHHGDQPLHVVLHGLTVDIPERLRVIIESLQPKERPFGSISIGAELAVSMGEDPRPYLTEEQIAEQLRLSGKTRKEWDEAWDRVCNVAGDYRDVPF